MCIYIDIHIYTCLSSIQLCLAKNSDFYTSLYYEGRETTDSHILVLETLDLGRSSSKMKEIKNAMAMVISVTYCFGNSEWL